MASTEQLDLSASNSHLSLDIENTSIPQSEPNDLSFDERLKADGLPAPGYSYYLARRQLWLTPRTSVVPPEKDSTSHRRIEELLEAPGATSDEGVWKSGIEKVWKGLVGGSKLKQRLPMSLTIQIIHSAWIRDNTWPAGGVATDFDAKSPVVVEADAPETTTATAPPKPAPVTNRGMDLD